MSSQMPRSDVYRVEPKNPFFEATRRIVEFECRPGNTVTFLAEIDLTEIEAVRAGTKAGPKPSYTAFVVKAVSMALKEFPYANRRVTRRAWLPWQSPRLQRFERSDIAVACERDFPGAESTAFIDIFRDADRPSLQDLTKELHALATCDTSNNQQWREFSTIISRLPTWLATWLIRMPCFVPDLWVKYRGGAVLISSPAKYGVDVVMATWSHPLGVSFGLVKKRPVVKDDQVVACPTFTLTMNFDRRVMAGAQGARFFKRLVEILEHAEREMAGFLPEAEGQPSANGQPAPEPAGAH